MASKSSGCGASTSTVDGAGRGSVSKGCAPSVRMTGASEAPETGSMFGTRGRPSEVATLDHAHGRRGETTRCRRQEGRTIPQYDARFMSSNILPQVTVRLLPLALLTIVTATAVPLEWREPVAWSFAADARDVVLNVL